MSGICLDAYEKELIAMAKEISYYLQRSGASPADSQEIVQDVLVTLLETDLVLPYDKLRAWLYCSAIQAYIIKYYPRIALNIGQILQIQPYHHLSVE